MSSRHRELEKRAEREQERDAMAREQESREARANEQFIATARADGLTFLTCMFCGAMVDPEYSTGHMDRCESHPALCG